jgi:hypothetical protein
MRIIKQRLKEMIPAVEVFLDVRRSDLRHDARRAHCALPE